jgi:hypothetical protein
MQDIVTAGHRNNCEKVQVPFGICHCGFLEMKPLMLSE